MSQKLITWVLIIVSLLVGILIGSWLTLSYAAPGYSNNQFLSALRQLPLSYSQTTPEPQADSRPYVIPKPSSTKPDTDPRPSASAGCEVDESLAIAGLPAASPSGQWCRVRVATCEAAWCYGYYMDQPTSAQSIVFYDCNNHDGNGEGFCKKITAAQLPKE